MNLISNERKFLQFYDQNVTKIYRYVYFRVGSEQVAQDLSAEAFMRTWQYLKAGKEIDNISAMVYKVCRNAISDYFRNNSDIPNQFDVVSESNSVVSESALVVSESDLVRKTDASIELDIVKDKLRLIRPEYQEMIIWYYIDDFEVPEIAQIIGKSEGAVRVSISRALKA